MCLPKCKTQLQTLFPYFKVIETSMKEKGTAEKTASSCYLFLNPYFFRSDFKM